MDKRKILQYFQNEGVFPRAYSRRGKTPTLILYRFLILLGFFAFLFTLHYLFFPWTSLSSYKDRKLKFKLVTDISAPTRSFNSTYLLILISSAPSHFQQRQVIRATWANKVSLRGRRRSFSGATDWEIVFTLGKTADVRVNARVQQEAARFDDILLGEFQDLYENLVIKTIMGLSWASRVNCTYVLKADDDVYVHISRLITWLRWPTLPARLYAGYINTHSRVVRRTTSKFYIDLESYNAPYFPNYCAGPFYVLSRNILPALVNLTSFIKPIFIEDAYIGILTQSLGVKPVDSSETFVVQSESGALKIDECSLTSLICLGHGLSPPSLNLIHTRCLAIENLSQEQKDWICVRDKLIFVTEILCLGAVIVVTLYFCTRRLIALLRICFTVCH